MKQDKTDILVVGSGMAGLAFAALAAQQGFAVTVIDRVHPETLATEGHDARTVALSAGSRAILAPLNIWDKIVPHSAAITEIDVQEKHDPFLLNFEAGKNDSEAFGWIFPNTVVRQTLYETATGLGVKFIAPAVLKDIIYPTSPAQAGVHGATQPIADRPDGPRSSTGKSEVMAILQSGEKIAAQLIIGADGRFSRVRDLIGVAGVTLDYNQTALVGLVEHEFPHNGLAVERFYPTGPFAVLPFTDAENKHRSAIVWTQDTHKKQKQILPTIEQITEQLTPLFDERYGKIKAIGKWAQYPLSLFHAKQFIAPRVALISDAAHAIHPIAGQGLNLGMRDVDVLIDELLRAKLEGEDIGGKYTLETYQSRRRFDVFAMVAATDILNRLFGNKLRSIGWLRSAGLGLVDKINPLKKFFANTAMGK
jgi:2-octaprenyl-6-methoxyphenol hydroxylase